MSTLKVNNLQDLGADAVVTNGVVDKAALPSGSVLQVVQAVKTDTFSTSSTSYVDVTGMTATITPSSTSSKILVLTNIKVGNTANASFVALSLLRGSTVIYGGDASGSRDNAAQSYFFSPADRDAAPQVSIFLDSPNTTSATTYKIQMKTVTAHTAYVNRSSTDGDNTQHPRTASSITLMEIAG